MIGALIRVRFQSLFAGLVKRGMKNGKKAGKGMVALFIILYAYVAVVICGMMAFLFYSLAGPYHSLGLDWLYFSMAGLISLAMAVFGTVFTTQNQLYAAKDNDLLLAMPIKPGTILLSRMVSLLVMNLLFVGLIMGAAIVVYAVTVGFVGIGFCVQILSILAITLLAQAISCLLGWLLHLVTGKMNKSLASVLFMVAFLVVYFGVYTQANAILTSMVIHGFEIADSLQSWVWPIYALGMGCTGELLPGTAFIAICLVCFAGAYYLLSRTFLQTATASHSAKRKKVNLSTVKAGSKGQALIQKELRRFLGTPVYLTNMGIGLVFVPLLGICGVLFRSKLLEQFSDVLPVAELVPYFPLVITAMLMFMNAMNCISTPSVSLEGKSLWVLKSLPISGKDILKAKLRFHLLLTCPVTVFSGIVLSAAYGCDVAGIALTVSVSCLAALLSGLLGMVFGLQWARLDWINEAYPCKQSVAVGVVIFTMMLLPVGLGILYFSCLSMLSPNAFLAICGALLVVLCAGLYRLMVTWGVKKWNAL